MGGADLKTVITIVRRLWNPTLTESGGYEDHTFLVEIDPDKLKPAILHKARKNKAKRSRTLNGAVVIRAAD